LNFQVHSSWNNCIANTRNFSLLKNPFTDTNNKNWPGVPLNFVFVSPFFSSPNHHWSSSSELDARTPSSFP
jgi:hypothetical protein